MLRITTNHSAETAKNYFGVALKTSDYNDEGCRHLGRQRGRDFGTQSDVHRKDFVAFANNRWPGANGKRLTARMNKTRLEDVIDKSGMPTIDPETGTVRKREVSNRRAGYDFTFSAPKSVSLYLAINEDKVVEQMITEAVDETMAAIEARMETKSERDTSRTTALAQTWSMQSLFTAKPALSTGYPIRITTFTCSQ